MRQRWWLFAAPTLRAAAATEAANALPAKLGDVEARLRAAHDATAAFAVAELFRGCADEAPSPQRATVSAGALPANLRGAVLRLGPNARFPTGGRKNGGWLDGDGMVHAVVLGDGGPAYSRTWLRTEPFAKEEAAGRKLFEGTLVAPYGLRLLVNLAKNLASARQPQKDTANTALLAVGGRIFALMEQCRPTEFEVSGAGAIKTVRAGTDMGFIDAAAHPLSGGALTAHIHREGGDAIGVTYSTSQPYARVDVLDAKTGDFKRSHGIGSMRAPVMLHDSALTAGENGYVVILDLPLTVRPRRMLADRFPVEYEPEHGARVGLVRRSSGETIWIDVAPGVVLHAVNAHERDDGTVVLTGLRSVPASPTSFIEAYSPAFLYEWVLDPRSATCVRERYLSSVPCEFPCLDPRATGTDAASAYAIRVATIGGPNPFGPPDEGIFIDGVVRFDLRRDFPGDAAVDDVDAVAEAWTAPPGYSLVSEPTYVGTEGGGGHVLVFGTAVAAGGTRDSKLFVLDGDDLKAGPTCVVDLPGDVPYGLHSCWVPEADLRD